MTFLPADMQTLAPDSLIELLEFSEFNTINPYETLYVANYTGCVFEGIEYLAIGFETSGFDIPSQGTLPQPKITLSNIGRIVGDFLFRAKTEPTYRLEGMKVTRRLTQKQFLDSQPRATDSIREFARHVFVLEQVSAETYLAVEFTLSSPFDLEDLTLPGRPALRQCPWIYRGAECSYAGTAGYTLQNTPTLDLTQDRCAKSLAACKARFGAAAELPTGAFPGLGSF